MRLRNKTLDSSLSEKKIEPELRGKTKGGELSVIIEEEKRWLKALKIAKIIFEDQGYPTHYLDEVERFVKRKLMYNPRVKREYLPILSKISASKGIPMTQLVNQIIRDYLNEEGMIDERKGETSSGEHSEEV